MPLIQISVPAGSLTPEQKRDLVARITDVVVDVEGIPAIRPAVLVHVNEVIDGGWGAGGKVATLEQMKARLGVV
jgi:4-oxalocrotonate tautomerase